MFLIPFGQIVAPRQPRNAATANRDERLRRVGYADGERLPRTPRHWANR